MLSHPMLRIGWGTLFRAYRNEKQILRFAQDDIVCEAMCGAGVNLFLDLGWFGDNRGHEDCSLCFTSHS